MVCTEGALPLCQILWNSLSNVGLFICKLVLERNNEELGFLASYLRVCFCPQFFGSLLRHSSSWHEVNQTPGSRLSINVSSVIPLSADQEWMLTHLTVVRYHLVQYCSKPLTGSIEAAGNTSHFIRCTLPIIEWGWVWDLRTPCCRCGSIFFTTVVNVILLQRLYGLYKCSRKGKTRFPAFLKNKWLFLFHWQF